MNDVKLTSNDFASLIEGVAELTFREDWIIPHRMPVEGEKWPIDPELRINSDMATGVRIAFTTDADSIQLDAKTTPLGAKEDGVAPFDIVIDGVLFDRQSFEGVGRVHIKKLGSRSKSIDIWLPHFGTTEVRMLTAKRATYVKRLPSNRPHWITYGSSITQCKESDGPSETWPSIIASRNNWRLTNLGFGGQCHVDPTVARYIKNTNADAISLCLGINIWGQSSFTRRTLAPALVGFIATIRDGHPTTPIVVSTPIASPEREEKHNDVGLSLGDIRAIVKDVTLSLQQGGDSFLHVINGLEILSIDEESLLQDGLHPRPEGYKVMAERMELALAKLQLMESKD